jgi:hypothetical protein
MVTVDVEMNGEMLDIRFRGAEQTGSERMKRIDMSDLISLKRNDAGPVSIFFHQFPWAVDRSGQCIVEIVREYEPELRALEPFIYNSREYSFEGLVEQIYAETPPEIGQAST